MLDVQNRNDTDLALKLLFSWKLGELGWAVSVICSDLYVPAIFSYFSDHDVYVCVICFWCYFQAMGRDDGLFFLGQLPLRVSSEAHMSGIMCHS